MDGWMDGVWVWEGGRKTWEDVVLMLSLCLWGFSVFGDSRCAMPLGTCAL